MTPVLRRPKKKTEKISITNLPSPPTLEEKIYSQSIYYPILSPPPTLSDEILNRPPLHEEVISGDFEYPSTLPVEDDLTSDILKEIIDGGFGSILKSIPPQKPRVLHVEELAIKEFKAAKDAYISAGEKHLELKFYENACCLFSCAILCVLLSEDAFQAAHLMKDLGSRLPSTVINSHIFQGVKLLLKATLLKKEAYLKQAENWLFHDPNHMYKEDRELIERAIRESKLAIETHAFDA
jgi:hypothetical protein